MTHSASQQGSLHHDAMQRNSHITAREIAFGCDAPRSSWTLTAFLRRLRRVRLRVRGGNKRFNRSHGNVLCPGRAWPGHPRFSCCQQQSHGWPAFTGHDTGVYDAAAINSVVSPQALTASCAVAQRPPYRAVTLRWPTSSPQPRPVRVRDARSARPTHRDRSHRYCHRR
jgi:hypothetical protein